MNESHSWTRSAIARIGSLVSVALCTVVCPSVLAGSETPASGQPKTGPGDAPAAQSVTVEQQVMGKLADGTQVDLYTMANSNGLEVRVMTYGATLVGVLAPDRNGLRRNITLYLDTLEDYEQGHPLFGSVVGRYANRIAGAAFDIGGTRYQLTANVGKKDHIHGGRLGFQKIVWKAEPFRETRRAGVILRHVSPDGHEGYPGRLNAKVVYAVTDDNRLVMDYSAETDQPTHVNLTNHAYWNLAGAGSGDVLDHVVTIHADQYVVADKRRFPTGEIRDVAGTPLDFREPHRIGARINQLASENYDDCYVLSKEKPGALTLAARVREPESGRVMEVYTTQPGMQFYTAKGLRPSRRAADGPYGPYHGFCLETQHFPDAPNQPHFPSTLLKPGETYHQVTVHSFTVE